MAASRISMMGILMSHLVTFFSLFAYHVSNGLELVQINSTLLSVWYDELAVCMIDNPNLQYPKAVEYCWQKWPGRIGFRSLPTQGSLSEEFLGHCSTLDMPQVDRGFNLGFIF